MENTKILAEYHLRKDLYQRLLKERTVRLVEINFSGDLVETGAILAGLYILGAGVFWNAWNWDKRRNLAVHIQS